jgi:chromosome segregation ATPase
MDTATAATIESLRQQLDAARQALNDTDMELAKAMSRAEVLAAEVRGLLAVIDAHDMDTMDCDRTGDKYCDCLRRQMDKIRTALDAAKFEEQP